MPIPTFTGTGPNPTFDDIVKKVNTLVNELRNVMLNLDDVNFDKITANVINVQQLSAIAADLGTITAGFIYGTYIATKNGAYPRAEMDSTNNHFAAFADANHYLKVGSFGTGSVPFLEFRDLTASALSAIINLGTQFQVQSQKRMDITSSTDDIFITANNIRLQSLTRILFSNLMDGAGSSLSTQLSNKADKSAISKTVYVAATNGAAATIPMTITNGVITG